MEYIKVAEVANLPTNKMIAVEVKGQEILIANVDGAYFAISNKCTHLGGSLAKGAIDGSVIRCPKHGARFDVKTGKAVGEAKLGFIKMKVADEKTFPIRVEGSDILVGIS